MIEGVDEEHDVVQSYSTLRRTDDIVISDGNVEQPTDAFKDTQPPTETTKYSSSEEKARKCSCIRNIPERCPRCCACIGGIVLPLWLLVFVALIGGAILAHFEAPEEYESNDTILANKNIYFLSRDRLGDVVNELLELPQSCLADYLNTSTVKGSNKTLYELFHENGTYFDGNINLNELSILTQIPGLSEYMQDCGTGAETIVDTLLEVQNSSSLELASESMTFNWIRCWNETEIGDHLSFRANKQALEAAAQQQDYYVETWHRNKERLYEQNIQDLGDNITDSDRLEAWKRAVEDATGSDGCSANVAGSAWFFFTVMTTIGYGNQVTRTAGGRAVVACLGFFSIFAFGAVSATAAQILIVVFDDFVARCNLKVLSRPAVGVFLWTLVTLVWTIVFAVRSFNWWKDRLPEEDQPYATFWDSVWFAFLTTTTIGLGDFYFQPAYLFIADIFSLSLMCLISFVFFATLIGQVGIIFSGSLPDAVGKLRSRVERTNLTNTALNETKPVDTELINILEELLANDNQNLPDSPRSLAIIVKEEVLLTKVLTKVVEERQRVELMGE